MVRMKRVAKGKGFGNIVIEKTDIPAITDRQILVRVRRSLVSRGSGIGGRYRKNEEVDPSRMGYSAAGVVEQVGAQVNNISVGDRAVIVAPHAEYVVGDMDKFEGAGYARIPDEISFEQATFIPLATSAVGWARSARIREGDTVAVLGQGLVGALCLQTVRELKPGKVIAVDALQMRCNLARRLGADLVVDCSKTDPVRAVRDAAGGQGADVVMDCVGGPAGIKSFQQAQDMVRAGGVIQLIALYHEAPLPLDSSRVMGKLIVGGIHPPQKRTELMKDAMAMLGDGRIRVDEMITHRFPLDDAPEAFRMLHDRLAEVIGVIFEYE